MLKRKFTVKTQLHENNNQALIEYFEQTRATYNQALREAFQYIKHIKSFDKSKYNTYLQNKYDITKRTANSIINDAQGRYNALVELKKYEQQQLRRKIDYLSSTLIPKLTGELQDNLVMMKHGLTISLIKHHNLRRKIVAKKNHLNQYRQQLANLDYQLSNRKLKLCFGTTKLLKGNYSKFIEQRDSQMTFVGAKAETCCNQMLQLTYSSRLNQFKIQLRKDFHGFKQAKSDNRYVIGQCYFRYYQSNIKHILDQQNSPLTFKIIKRDQRYYLYCVFEIQVDRFKTSSQNGLIGLDFNKGFITYVETNQYGHLCDTKRFNYRFRSGNCTTNDLAQIANQIVTLSRQTGKSIAIEDLDFKNKKAKREKRQGKKYNQMIHSLAYRKYVELLENIAYRNAILVKRVNPAWTSWLAKHLFCPSMKLNIHIGAAYEIARRGLGFKDKVTV